MIPSARRDIVVLPGDVVRLNGLESVDVDGPDGRPIAYQFTLVSRPKGSNAQVLESFADPLRPSDGGLPDNEDTAEAYLWLDEVGRYVVDLSVTDNEGLVAPSNVCPQAEARMNIEATTDGIIIQLFWDTPADPEQSDTDGTDMDLHLAHPTLMEWFDRDLDCHYRTPMTSWGTTEGNGAVLELDDVDGLGPEQIRLTELENTDAYGQPYRIGVHYYSDSGGFGSFGNGFGASDATVKVYFETALVFEETQRMDNWDFWEAAAIVWTAQDGRVEALDTLVLETPPPGL